MTLSLNQIYNLLGKDTGYSGSRGMRDKISHLLCDSRELNEPAETLFFALRTPSADGHRYIADLYERGVRNFVVEPDFIVPEECIDADFLIADSPRTALQLIATGVRAMLPDLISVGITGSRGKTQIKEMIYSALKSFISDVVRSPRSFNSQIGVPLSVWQLKPDTKIGIFEAGISRPGEMHVLEEMIQPAVGVFTSLTDEHSENFSSLEEKALEKALLFKSAKIVFCPDDNPIILAAIKKVNPHAEIVPVSADNCIMAMQVMARIARMVGIEVLEFGRPPDAVSTRIDVLPALNDCLIIFDGFTHDIQSLAEALNFMQKRSTASRSSTVIMPPVPGLESSSTGETDTPEVEKVCERVGQLLKSKNVRRLILIGEVSSAVKEVLEKYVDRFDSAIDCDDFIRRFSINDFDSELILVKGTKSVGFDLIANHLEAPRHETVMEVNLNALVNNYNFFKSQLPSGTGVITMVKADAYGLGALEVSKTMQAQGAAMLAVAVVDEGVALRQAGITMPIVVMNPIGTNFKALFDYRLEPSVFSMRELETLLRYAEIYNVRNYPVHVKFDTGMHRLGFTYDELDHIGRILKHQKHLTVASIFSHLATADCPDMDTHTEAQIALFNKGADRLASALSYIPKRHLLNTAGIIRYNEVPSDMARLGIGLYGLSPLPPEFSLPLQNVASLTSTIISLREWPEGTAIGYGRKGITTSPAVIATIPIGYADGIDRRLGNGRAAFRVNGIDCPTVGNICMDLCMIDVTDAKAEIGDKVVIFDSQTDIIRLADTLGTIPYEILTSISPRVKRMYFRE